jgi:2-amino-4-hydroxy-6-hydroxymethyldihydropteridine diphosphokinase
MATSLREPVSAFVALGANLGHPAQAVSKALTDLAQLPHTQVTAVSALYESAPHQADGPMYVNAVAALSTSLNAIELLQALQAMEQQAGRQRSVQNAPRTLDLDLLFFGHAHLSSAYLTVPHPRWQERAFVLLPLQDVAPERVDAQMLARVANQPIQRSVSVICDSK